MEEKERRFLQYISVTITNKVKGTNMKGITKDEKFRTIEKLHNTLTKIPKEEYDELKKELLAGVHESSRITLEDMLKHMEKAWKITMKI